MGQNTQQIKGLPAGATVEPVGSAGGSTGTPQISGLPPGASVEAIPQLNNADKPLRMFRSDTGAEQDVPRNQVGDFAKQGWQAGSAPQKSGASGEGFGTSFAHAAGVPASISEVTDSVKDKSVPQLLGGALMRFSPAGMAVRGYQAIFNADKKLATGHPLEAVEATPGGGAVKKTAEQVGEGNYSGAAGTLLGTAAPLLATKALERAGVGSVDEQGIKINGKEPVTREAARDNLVKAVNPAASDMGTMNAHGGGTGFKGNLDATLDHVVDAGQKGGFADKVTGAKTPGQALETAAMAPEAAYKNLPYFKEVMEPNLAKTADVTFNNYRGGKTGYNQATVAQLNDRLTAINAEMYGKYQQGGAGSARADAAVNAERVQSLQQEAAGIRDALDKTLARETGVPIDRLKGMRQQYGQLKDVADTMKLRAAELQHGENATANKTLSEQVPSHLSVPAVLLKTGAKVADKVRGNPVINGIQDAFKYKPTPPAPFNVNPPLAPTPYQAPNNLPFGRPGTQSSLPPEVLRVLQQAEEQNASPKTMTGKPLTERARRAANANLEAESRLKNSLPTSPPNAPQVEPLAPSVAGPQTGTLPLPNRGGTLNRPPLQLPPGPTAPPQLPQNASPIALPPSSVSQLMQYIESGSKPVPRSELPITTTPSKPNVARTAPLAPKSTSGAVESSNLPTVRNMTTEVNVIHPDGTPGTVPSAMLPEYLSKGYKLAAPLGRGASGGQ